MITEVLRIGLGLMRPIEKLYRRWRPKSDRISITTLAEDLADSVYQAERKLQQELRAGPGLFMHVRFTGAEPQQSVRSIESTEVDKIATFFDGLEQPRRLVVLGDPGAGKTVAATYLVRGLLELHRDLSDIRRAVEPVPVRVNATGWDGGQDFSAWLITRLDLDYRLRPNVGKEMVQRGLILPVLDGLDEMDDPAEEGEDPAEEDDRTRTRARALLDRLNQREWQDRPVVVLCRTAEFEDMKQQRRDNGLHGAVTLTLTSLSSEQVKDYLTDHRNRIGAANTAWDQILTRLRQDSTCPLAKALQNPWLLGLTITTLRDTPQAVSALLDCLDIAAVREQLFTAQISAAVAGTDDTDGYRSYTSDNVEKWMRSLARRLQHRRDTGRNGASIRLDEIWEIAGTTRVRILHAVTATLVATLLGVLAGGVAGGLAGGLTVGLTIGFMIGLAGGLANGFSAAVIKFPPARRIAWKVRSRSRWRAGLTFPGIFGLAFGLAGGLAGGLAVSYTVGLAVGTAGGLAVGLAFGFTGGLEANAEEQLALGTDEQRLIRDDVQSAVITGGLVGLVIGFTVGLMVWLAIGLEIGVAVGVAGWLASWLAIGLTGGLATGRYFLAVLVFKITADFPDRPAAFLVWARNSGLLRVNAASYQFRHQTYQNWFLRHPRRGVTDPPPVPSGSNPDN